LAIKTKKHSIPGVNGFSLFLLYFGGVAIPPVAFLASDARQIHALSIILYFAIPFISSFLFSRKLGDMKPFWLASSGGVLVGALLSGLGCIMAVFLAGAAESSGVAQAGVDGLFFGGLAAVFLGTASPAIFSYLLILKRLKAVGRV